MLGRVAMGLAILFSFACETPGIPDDAPSGDARTDAGAGDTPASMRRPLDLIVLRVEDGTDLRVEGALVVLDQAALPRREERSNAEGRAIFDAVDWSLGPVDVTVFVSGCILESRVGYQLEDFREDVLDTRPVIRVLPITRPGIQVTGTVSGMTDPASSWLAVYPTSEDPGYYDDRGPDYSLYVSPTLPFSLVVHDYFYDDYRQGRIRQRIFHWAATPLHTPAGVNERIDVDLATMSSAPTVVSASFQLPDDPFFTAVTPYIDIDERDESGGARIGSVTVLDLGIDRRSVTYQLESAVVPGLTGGGTLFRVDDETRVSMAFLPGRALTGPQDVPLLVPPEWGAAGLVTVGVPVPVLGATPDAHTSLAIAAPDSLTWRVLGAHDAAEIHVPALPADARPDVYLPPGTRATLVLCGGVRPEHSDCLRRAWASDRPIAP